MKAIATIMLRDGVLDPQGDAVRRALDHMGFAGIEDVRQGKVIELALSGNDPEQARRYVIEMCERLLANTVIESYRVEIEECGRP